MSDPLLDGADRFIRADDYGYAVTLVRALRDRLLRAEESDRESVLMYRRARDRADRAVQRAATWKELARHWFRFAWMAKPGWARRHWSIARANAMPFAVRQPNPAPAGAEPMAVCPDCNIPVPVSRYPDHFADHRRPSRASVASAPRPPPPPPPTVTRLEP